MNPEHDPLFHRYLDSRATPEETAAMSGLLAGDPAAAERFAEWARLDEALRCGLKSESRAAVFTRKLQGKHAMAGAAGAGKTTALWSTPRSRWIAAAAILTLLGSVALLNFWMDGPVLRQTLAAHPKPDLNSQDSFGDSKFFQGGSSTSSLNPAAELRRKLRGFALPHLHVRSAPLTDALATLERQWKDLPHADSGEAGKVRLAIAPEVLTTWKSKAEEPQVTLDLPGLSLHTALDLIAAQAGLKVSVSGDAVQLEADSRNQETGEKTWTMPLAGKSVNAFLASLRAPAPVNFMSGTVRTADAGIRTRLVETPPAGIAADGTSVNAEGLSGQVFDYYFSSLNNAKLTAESPAAAAGVEGGSDIDFASPTLAGQAAEGEPPAGNPDKGIADPKEEFLARLEQSQFFLTHKAHSPELTLQGASRSSLYPGQPTLAGWMGGFGVPEEKLNYQEEDGVLSVTGNDRTLRTASAVVAALQESVSGGVSLEMRVIGSAEGLPADFPTTGPVPAFRVETLFKTASDPVPAVPVCRLPPVVVAVGRAVNYQFKNGHAGITTATRPDTADGRNAKWMDVDANGMGQLEMTVSVAASKSGERWDFTVTPDSGITWSGVTVAGVGTGSIPSVQHSVMEGQWLAVPQEKAGIVLLLRATTSRLPD